MKNSDTKASVRDTYTYTEVAGEVENLNESDDDVCKRTYTYQEALELTGNGRYNYLLLMTCSLITIACALDMFGYATVVAAASCDLNVNLKQLGILASAPFAGVLFAYPWGYYADTRGRKRAMLISTSVGFTLAMISAFSTHWLFMLVVKIIGCSFSTASFTLTMALLGECTGDRHRRQYLFIMNSLNLSSDILAFGLAWLILPLDFKFPLPFLDTTFRPWRLYTITLALPLGIGTALLFCVYESPEFLACKGNSKKAAEILMRISEMNGVKKENYPVRHIILTDSKTPKDGSFWVNLKNQTAPIFRPPLLWRTVQLYFLLALCCVTNNAFTMWYPTMVNFFFKSFNSEDSSQQTFCHRMFGNTNSTDTTQTSECNDVISPNTMYSGILYGVFYWILSMAVVKVASRPRLLLIVVLLVSGVSMLLVNVKDPIANMVFFTLLQATSLGIGCISSYFVDLYPVMHRGMVTSLGMMVARLSSLTGVTLVGTVITQYCEVTFYTWAAFVLGAVIVCLFLPADRKTKKSDVIEIPS